MTRNRGDKLSLRSSTCRSGSAGSPCSTTCRCTSTRGELLALIGPNGAGKTSVLNCISGIYRGEGAIRLRGEDINGRPRTRSPGLASRAPFSMAKCFRR